MSKPEGLYHINTDKLSIKINLDIISMHQTVFPELATQMKNNPNNANNIYACFLALIPLQVKGELTEERRIKILTEFKMM